MEVLMGRQYHRLKTLQRSESATSALVLQHPHCHTVGCGVHSSSKGHRSMLMRGQASEPGLQCAHEAAAATAEAACQRRRAPHAQLIGLVRRCDS